MSANLAPVIRQFFYDSNGNPLSGGKLYSYQAGTTTPQATYTDSSAGTPNTNPVILDASGSANVWLDPALSYKFVLQDGNGVQQWSVDNVIGTLATNAVSTSVIQDGAVTRAKLAAGAVSNLGVVSKNAVFTAAVTDDIYLCDTSSGAYIATLPTAIGNSGKVLTFKKTTNDVNALTVKGNGSETIDGSNTIKLFSQWESVEVISNGSNWDVVTQKRFRIADYLATGTRITGSAPTALGQYRSYLRNANAATYTEVNGAPTTAPTSADGVLIYNGNAWSAADTNNSPTKYDIYVGTNKRVELIAYAGAGRTGNIDIRPVQVNGTLSMGYNTSYDPTTGIFSLVAYYSNQTETSHNSGSWNGTRSNNPYFDLIVSDQ